MNGYAKQQQQHRPKIVIKSASTESRKRSADAMMHGEDADKRAYLQGRKTVYETLEIRERERVREEQDAVKAKMEAWLMPYVADAVRDSYQEDYDYAVAKLGGGGDGATKSHQKRSKTAAVPAKKVDRRRKGAMNAHAVAKNALHKSSSSKRGVDRRVIHESDSRWDPVACTQRCLNLSLIART